jgi:hypothetical protein
MADLLECLIQIKALGHSIARLERFIAAAPAAAHPHVDAVMDRLIEAEHAYARTLIRRDPACDRGGSTPKLRRFSALRHEVLTVLHGYSAEGLGQPVAWPGRPRTSVADLVAIMLAHDTERIGEIQRLASVSR